MMVSAGTGPPVVHRERPGVLDPGAEPAREPCAHPGRAHVDHHRHAEPAMVSNSGFQAGLVDRVVPHDGVEVEAEHAVLADRGDRVLDGLLALNGSTAPQAPMNVSGCRSRQCGDVAVGAGRAPVTASMSNATRTASIPAALTPATTSSSDLPVTPCPQLRAERLGVRAWEVIHSWVPG